MIGRFLGLDRKLRYLVVGGWNTLFGYGAFAALYALVGHAVNYTFVLTASYVLAITNAYICYKLLVFRTRGDVLAEYLRFYVVYGAAFLVNLATLPLLVELTHLSPLVAQAIITVATVLLSYFGHRHFTFREPEDVFGDTGERD